MRRRGIIKRRPWVIALAGLVVVAAVYFGGRQLTRPQFIETSIQPEIVSPLANGSPRDFNVGFTWRESGWCVGEFRVSATESATQVRVGPVIDRVASGGACAGVGTVGNMAWAPLTLGSPLGKRLVVRDSDGAPLPVFTRGESLDCRDAIASKASPPPDLPVVFNVVALPTVNALQANLSGESDPSARLFAKVGVFVSSGSSLALVVPPEWAGRLTIGWGNPGRRTTRQYVNGFVSCEASGSQARWFAYAGGFWVGEPACVPLLVQEGSREQTVWIGIGAACPGQAAPPPGN